MQICDRIIKTYPDIFLGDTRQFRVMHGWQALIETTCKDIVSAITRNSFKGSTAALPVVKALDEDNGQLVFKIYCSDKKILQEINKYILKPAIDKSKGICMICGNDSDHKTDGFARTLCNDCEHNYQRRQYSRLDTVEVINSADAEALEADTDVAILSITEIETDDDADKIVDHVHRLSFTALEIIVHCKAGISRSAAVAKWIADAYGLEFDKKRSDYNKRVYTLINQAAERQWKRNEH